jgi:hypothetical protein
VRVDFDYFWLCALEPPGSASAGLPFSPVQPVLDAKRSLRCGCSSRWLGLVQTSSGWTGPTSMVVPPRVIRRGTPLPRWSHQPHLWSSTAPIYAKAPSHVNLKFAT